jgi:hypothetical protein
VSDTGAEGTQQAAPAVDLSGIESRISELGQEMNQRFEQFQPAQQDQGQGFGEEPDYSAFDYGQQEPGFQYGEQQQPQQPDQNQEGMQLLQKMVSDATQQAIGPLMQRFEQQDTQQRTDQWEQQVDAFEQKYQLDDQASEQLAGKAYEIAGQLAGEMLQWLPPQAQQALKQTNTDLAELIATRPGFLENVFLAGRAQSSAEQETPASTSQGTELEQGGGAAVSSDQEPGSQWLGSGQKERSLDQVLGW